MKTILSFALILPLLVLAPAVAGTRYDFESEQIGRSPAVVSRYQVTIDGRRARVDTFVGDAAEPRMSILYLGERREMLMLDHQQRQSMVIDREMMQQLGGQLKQMREQMESAMAQLPPEQRAQMEKMMAGRLKGMMPAEAESPIEMRKTDERGTTNDFPWIKWEAVQDGEKVGEFLVTDWKHVGGKQEIVDLFREMSEFSRELMDGLGQAVQVEDPFRDLSRLDGFPVVTRTFEGGRLRQETRFSAFETIEVAPGTFDDPGYKRQRIEVPSPR